MNPLRWDKSSFQHKATINNVGISVDWRVSMKDITLLDCTLRDGGHLTNNYFGKDVIYDIVKKLIATKVDVIEVGFLKDCEFDPDYARYNNVAEAMSVLPEKPNGVKYALLTQEDQYNDSKLEECNGDIEVVRVSFHDYDIQEGLDCAARIAQKGYKVYINPINLLGYSQEQVIELVKKVNAIHPYGFTIVDTFGSMRKNDLLRLYYLIDNLLTSDINLAVHLHENLSLSYSLAQQFVEIKSPTRDITIDGSLYGMGRVPGNLCIELIMEHLNYTCGANYNVDPAHDAIDAYIADFKKEFNWGYSCAYALSAQHKVHRTFAEHLLKKGKLCTKQINQILSMIEPSRRTKWDEAYIESLYAKYQDQMYDDTEDISQLENALKGKEVLLIAPGASIISNADEIVKFISNNDVVTICTNFMWDKCAPDYMFFTNFQRWENYGNSETSGKKIITSNLINDNIQSDYVVNYSDYAYSLNKLFDNCGVMLMNLMKKLAVKRIYLAGFDGFKGENDFYRDHMAINDSDKYALNYDVAEIIGSLRTQVPVQFLTPSLYERENA